MMQSITTLKMHLGGLLAYGISALRALHPEDGVGDTSDDAPR